MAISEIKKDSGLVRVIAEQAAHRPVAANEAEEAQQIVAELAKDNSPENRHKLAQLIAYSVDKMQAPALDFLGIMADVKNIGYNEKVVFNFKTEGIKAFYQAKGATTARSYISARQFTLGTEAISARPAINVVDLWTGRVQAAEIVAEANREMTYQKLIRVEAVLIASMSEYGAPFYSQSTGVNKAALDDMLTYFNRIGPCTILGDRAAVQQIASIVGWAPKTVIDTGIADPSKAGTTYWPTSVSDGLIDEYNNTGLIGTYIGNRVMVMPNGYRDNSTAPILAADKLYVIPGNVNADQRNLKVVNEGPVQAFESQNIDDLTFEIRLEQWFGAGFISGATNKATGNNTGRIPHIGMLDI